MGLWAFIKEAMGIAPTKKGPPGPRPVPPPRPLPDRLVAVDPPKNKAYREILRGPDITTSGGTHTVHKTMVGGGNTLGHKIVITPAPKKKEPERRSSDDGSSSSFPSFDFGSSSSSSSSFDGGGGMSDGGGAGGDY